MKIVYLNAPNTNKTTRKKLTEIEKALAPYSEWKAFSRSPYSFLHEKELAALENYRKYHNYQYTARQYGITTQRVNVIMNKAIKKILCCHNVYEQWQELQIMIKNGIKD